jgi:hypothetical protein
MITGMLSEFAGPFGGWAVVIEWWLAEAVRRSAGRVETGLLV